MDIVSYRSERISATPKHHDGVHWLQVVIHEKEGMVSALTLFFDSAELVTSYAAAINSVPTKEADESEAA